LKFVSTKLNQNQQKPEEGIVIVNEIVFVAAASFDIWIVSFLNPDCKKAGMNLNDIQDRLVHI
jgi:hypothetical protein